MNRLRKKMFQIIRAWFEKQTEPDVVRGRNGVKRDWFPLVSWVCFVHFNFLNMSCGAVLKWHFCTIRANWRAQRCSICSLYNKVSLSWQSDGWSSLVSKWTACNGEVRGRNARQTSCLFRQLSIDITVKPKHQAVGIGKMTEKCCG